jgi:hypothetical protein
MLNVGEDGKVEGYRDLAGRFHPLPSDWCKPTEPIVLEGCCLEDDGKPQGDGRVNVVDPFGSAIFSVTEGEYPADTLFDVTITFTTRRGEALHKVSKA